VSGKGADVAGTGHCRGGCRACATTSPSLYMVSTSQVGTAQAQTDLVLSMEEGEELTGGIAYAAELFLPATAERMAAHFVVRPKVL